MAVSREGALSDAKQAARKTHPGPWWVPSVVSTPAQVDLIVRQARRFGSMSPAGRFLQRCIDVGVITEDHRLAK